MFSFFRIENQPRCKALTSHLFFNLLDLKLSQIHLYPVYKFERKIKCQMKPKESNIWKRPKKNSNHRDQYSVQYLGKKNFFLSLFNKLVYFEKPSRPKKSKNYFLINDHTKTKCIVKCQSQYS
jgi:hypothetical protein